MHLRLFLKKYFLWIPVLSLALFLSACGTSIDSTANRYKRDTDEKVEQKPEARSPQKHDEDFDFSPYFLKIRKDEVNHTTGTILSDDLWRDYPKADTTQKVTVKVPGYRVQVLATDNLDEAQQMRLDVYFKTNKSEIYITFQPPLYKVTVGDYKTLYGANNLAFKLNQLGFSPTQVVTDSVNIQK